MKYISIILLTIISITCQAQVAGNFKQLRLLNNTDSLSLGSTTGIVRYDPITGKFRFFNALTQTWFSFTKEGSGGITGTGSADRIAYWAGASALSYGPYWDNTNSKLGIGITPTANLDILASGNSQLRVSTNGAGSQSEIILSRSAGTTSMWSLYNPSGSTDLRFYSSASDKFTFTSAGVFKFGVTPLTDNTATPLAVDASGYVVKKTDAIDGSGSSTGVAIFSDGNTLSSDTDMTFTGGNTLNIGPTAGTHGEMNANGLYAYVSGGGQYVYHTWYGVEGFGADMLVGKNGGAFVSFSNDNITITKGVANNGSGFKHTRVSTGSIGAGLEATIIHTWATPFVDANYTVAVDVLNSTGDLVIISIAAVTSTQVQVLIKNNDMVSPVTGDIHLIAIHD